ncbi:MAG TPA: endo-1,4-beta-xylanase [Opitutaceae bacterium]|nr:endo-1,4-beta-xylanase [Opitutaceae bacterium]
MNRFALSATSLKFASRILGCTLLASLILNTAVAATDATAAAIRQHRMGTIVVEAAPGATIKVEQERHEFWFGAALANQAFDGRMPPADAARYKEVFLEHFNSAVTENALKWLAMEREQGKVNYATVDAILEWTDANGIPLRGHNIYWGIEKFVQPWLMSMDNEALRSTLEARGRDIGRRYRGRFVEYDLNNEMIHGNFYADRLGKRITLEMTQWIHAEDPEAKLWLNDYDILTGKRLNDYIAHIRELVAMGVPVAGIGVQGHLHAETFDRNALRRSLVALEKLNLPIRVTEFNMPGQRSVFEKDKERVMTAAEEEAKARDLVDYYRICFASPAVTGILMWGFWENSNWIPASSLFKSDWTPTPAAKSYRDLVYGEWWTRWEGKADASGRCEVPAFFGTHRVSADNMSAILELKKSDGTVTVNLR